MIKMEIKAIDKFYKFDVTTVWHRILFYRKMESKLDIKYKSDYNKCKASLTLEVGKCEK